MFFSGYAEVLLYLSRLGKLSFLLTNMRKLAILDRLDY